MVGKVKEFGHEELLPLAFDFAEDNSVKSMVETMKKEGREAATIELSTGHCPNLIKAKEVADVISKVAMG
ncbi:Alpha/beta hydrolase fold-1 [Apiospora phragmitis]|uniref:Alpha/beta hydrolase fold-1 n=1 Tax=Apiospora phragmitis TaxID=2905665 RepID=A0ABR1VE44_9PEZI